MALPRLLVLASTFPRWSDDHEPGFVQELSRRLTNQFEVHVVAPHAPGAKMEECMNNVHVHRFRYAPDVLETLVQNGGMLANLKRSRWKWLLVPLFFLSLQYKTTRLIRQLKPQAIHAHWIIPQGLVLAILSCFTRLPPILLTSHGGDLFSLKGKIFSRIKRWVLSKSQHIAVVSNAMRIVVLELGAPNESISVISMGIDFSNKFIPPSKEQREPHQILFVGRLVEKKGVRYLIDVMPNILSLFPSASLVIAGFGPEENLLQQRAAALQVEEKVHFLGGVPQHELPLLYQKSAVFVAPFVQADNGDVEGLGLVVAEAIGCLCPVIVGDVPAVYDFLDSMREWIIPPRETEKLSNAIVKVLLSKDASYQKVSLLRNKLVDRFSWDEVAHRYAQQLEYLIENKGK